MTTWFLAVCQDCHPVLPVPFTGKGERNTWAAVHRTAAGHRVEQMTEIRRQEKPGEAARS